MYWGYMVVGFGAPFGIACAFSSAAILSRGGGQEIWIGLCVLTLVVGGSSLADAPPCEINWGDGNASLGLGWGDALGFLGGGLEMGVYMIWADRVDIKTTCFLGCYEACLACYEAVVEGWLTQYNVEIFGCFKSCSDCSRFMADVLEPHSWSLAPPFPSWFCRISGIATVRSSSLRRPAG